MVRNSAKRDANGGRKTSEKRNKLEDDLDALFRLPLADFTAARNALAGQLKRSGRGDEAAYVKALVKPSITAWAVNQLYWNHRAAFDRLIASGERFRQAQTSHVSRKVADMRAALDARRKELSNLSDLATALLRDAGHNSTPDTIHRISTTLEAISAYESLPDAARPGRLTHDVDPPGFDTLASFIPSAGTKEEQPARVTSSRKSSRKATSTRGKAEQSIDQQRLKEERQANITAAKISLQDAKKLLSEARARAVSLEAEQKRVVAEARAAEKQKREAEERFNKARVASEGAARRARSLALEVDEAAKAVHDAKRTVEELSKELELLFRGLTGK